MSDDGFINLRIVWNVLHGHGPVFNIGERVEAGTSPLWIAILAIARMPLYFLDPAWVAVLFGIAFSLVGLAFAILGAKRWWASLGREALLPAGAVVLIAIPPMWDFATSGLETGLSFAWLGVSWWAMCRRLDADDDARPAPHDPWWTPALIGLAVLVRPDFAVFGAALAVALAVTSTRGRRACATALGLGLALPVGYQIFRMGYFGLLVPNTALAKEAGRDLSGRGQTYVDAFLGTTLFRLSALLLVVVFVASLVGTKPSRRHIVVALALPIAGLLHAYYVIRVGGDFMYGRMVLPATFAIACPAAALPLPRPDRRLVWAPIVALAITAAVCSSRRWEPDGLDVLWFGDERQAWIEASGGRAHPVTIDDYDDTWSVEAADRWDLDDEVVDIVTGDRAPAPRPVASVGAVGMVAVLLWDTHVADEMSLAEPIGAHLEAGRSARAGHEKRFPWVWVVGRFGEEPLEDPDARAAREALGCGDLGELVDAVSEPLSPGRFLRNLVGSVDRTTLRVPKDPQEARDRFCED